ncbi:hypothetical protein [Streptomyces sp. NBC_00094]|uniref:hypothetical protein n=1 Tax=Streptomyces sp. NBC_00094 TaxID=2903620 RepID=UPI002254D811|nr:hypothetical protein [Streptomyces sp. NBC_00094]MCX5395096.1 hypothetical protein [Streptomyces sp. NBC_00094]
MIHHIVEHLANGPYGDGPSIRSDSDALFDGLTELLTPPGKQNLTYSRVPTSARKARLRAELEKVLRGAPSATRDQALTATLAPSSPLTADADFSVSLRVLGIDTPASDQDIRWITEEAVHDLRAEGYGAETPEFDPSLFQQERIDEAKEFLSSALGRVATETLPFSGNVLILAGTFDSAYLTPTPLTIVVNERILRDPVYLAESLLHETLHQKFGDLLLVRRLLPPQYTPTSGPFLNIPWNPTPEGPRQMDSVRVLSTLHVYTHLSLFHLTLHAMGSGDTTPEKVSEYIARAHFFAHVAGTAMVGAHTGPESEAFTEWLGDALMKVLFHARSHGIQPDIARYIRAGVQG